MITISKERVQTILLLFVLQTPSLAPLMKYSHLELRWFILYSINYLIGFSFFYHILFFKIADFSLIQKILNSRFMLLSLCVLLFVMVPVLYQHELSLQALGRGSDGGEALIISGVRLLHGDYPYLHLTHLQNPISPGPGWIIMAIPFTCTGWYFLFTPTLIVFSALVIQKMTSGTLPANLYLVCLYSSPAFWQDVVTGNDYLAMGIVYGLITIGLFYGWQRKRCYQVWLIISTGLAATARINFWYLGPLLGFFLAVKNRKAGIFFGLVSLLITLFLHVGFFLWSPAHYTPLHVVYSKGGAVLNSAGITTLMLACVIVGIIAQLKLENSLRPWLFLLWLCLTVPLLIVAIFTLAHNHWDLYGDGLSYIMLTSPILVFWAIMR